MTQNRNVLGYYKFCNSRAGFYKLLSIFPFTLNYSGSRKDHPALPSKKKNVVPGKQGDA